MLGKYTTFLLFNEVIIRKRRSQLKRVKGGSRNKGDEAKEEEGEGKERRQKGNSRKGKRHKKEYYEIKSMININ